MPSREIWLFANWRFHTHSETQTHALCATSGASDYAVRPNQFPVFGLMDAIIFMDLKQVSVPPPPPQPPQPSRTHTHMHTLNKVWFLNPLRRYGSVKDVKICVMIFSFGLKLRCKCAKSGFNSLNLMMTFLFGECTFLNIHKYTKRVLVAVINPSLYTGRKVVPSNCKQM